MSLPFEIFAFHRTEAQMNLTLVGFTFWIIDIGRWGGVLEREDKIAFRAWGREFAMTPHPFGQQDVWIVEPTAIKEVSMWKKYRRRGSAELRPYVPGEDLSNVSVSAGDTPEEGGMIARNPRDPTDLWYITKEYVENNFEPIEE